VVFVVLALFGFGLILCSVLFCCWVLVLLVAYCLAVFDC